MSDTAIDGATARTPDMGLAARVINIFLSPRAAYEAVAARPRSLGVLLVVILVIGIGQFIFLSTEIGRQATLDQQIQGVRMFGLEVTDEMVQQMEARLSQARVVNPISIAVFVPIITAIVAGLVMAVFTAILGGDATFRQAFAVVAHSQLIGALAQIFSLPISYAREQIVSPTQMAVFFPTLEEMGFLYYLLSAIDLFWIWAMVNLAIGIAVLYKRQTSPVAWALLGLYAVIAVIIAVWRS